MIRSNDAGHVSVHAHQIGGSRGSVEFFPSQGYRPIYTPPPLFTHQRNISVVMSFPHFTMSTNISKKRRLEGTLPLETEPREDKRVKYTPNSDLTICQKPSRSLVPPERPGSIQYSLAFAPDEVFEPPLSSEPYKYTPLHDGEFRLLRLHPGQLDDPIHCSLFIDNLDAPSSYEALSYCWGNRHQTRDILLSDEDRIGTFTVPRSAAALVDLCAFLKQIRMRDRPVVLWVDWFCIDQSNHKEKSSQVSKLGQIYATATRALLWLGEGSAATNWALSNMKQALKPGFFKQRFNNADGFTNICASTFISAMGDFWSSSWWTRAWTFQEACLAQRTTFICGSKQVDSKDVSTLQECISQHERSSGAAPQHPCQSDIRSHSHAAVLFKFAATAIKRSADGEAIGRAKPLMELLLGTSHLQTSDARDRVYALLGLAKISQDGIRLLQPDYTKGVLEVYQETIYYCILESLSLDIVLHSWAPINRPKSEKAATNAWSLDSVPSWVGLAEDLPFGNPGRKTACKCSSERRINGDDIVGWPRLYNASRGITADVQFGPVMNRTHRYDANGGDGALAKSTVPKPSGDSRAAIPSLGTLRDRILITDGVEIGTITDLSTRMADGVISRDCLEMCGMSFLDGCEARQNTPSKVWDRLWRTLVANRDANGDPAPSRFGPVFFSLFRRILKMRSLDTVEILDEDPEDNTAEFLKRVRDVTWNRRVFRSVANNYGENVLGMAPRSAQIADRIVILFGCSVPVIIRPKITAGESYVKIVGPAYVDGKMEGEALDLLDKTTMSGLTQCFQIV